MKTSDWTAGKICYDFVEQECFLFGPQRRRVRCNMLYLLNKTQYN